MHHLRTVEFTQWTLVSVCHSSMHADAGHRRFEIFQDKVCETPVQVRKHDFHVDLHTSQSPITACGCTRLRDLFLTTEGADRAVVVLFAVKRKAETDMTFYHLLKSKERTYIADAVWQASVKQTERGMAALLSSLYQLAHSMILRGTATEDKVLSILYEMTHFPPSVRARESPFRRSIACSNCEVV